jgi:hypothetical protein
MSVDKTLWATVDFDEVDVCTISEEADAPQVDPSGANPWDPNAAEDPDQGRLFCDNGVLACVHLVSTGGALNVSGKVQFVEAENCEEALKQTGIAAFCGEPDLPMVGTPEPEKRILDDPDDDPTPEPEDTRQPDGGPEEREEVIPVPELTDDERGELAVGADESTTDDRVAGDEPIVTESEPEPEDAPRSYSAEVPR